MKRILLFLLVLASFGAKAQIQVDSLIAKQSLKLAGKRVTGISNDVVVRANDSSTLITKAAARLLGGFDPTSNQTITGNWEFDNAEVDIAGDLYFGYNNRAGIQASGTQTIVGSWNGGNGTQLKIDDNAENFQFWCYDYNEDYPTAQFNGNGSSSFGWGNLTIDNTGILTSKNQLSVNNPAANDGFGARINITADQIQSFGTTPNEDNYAFTLNNQGVSGYYPVDIGTPAGWEVNYNGASGYNPDGSSWDINHDGIYMVNGGGIPLFSYDVNGLRLSPDGDTYVWMRNNGNVALGNGGFDQTLLNPSYIKGYSESLETDSWQINNSNGSVSFDNGLITSDANGNLHANTISLWDNEYGTHSGIYTNSGIWSFYNSINDYYGNLNFGFINAERNYQFPDKDITVAGIEDVQAAKGAHTIFTPTTGSTITSINNSINIVKPAANLSALTISLPTYPYCFNNDVIEFKFTKAITTVTYSGGTIAAPLTSPIAGSYIKLVYDEGTNTWY